MTFEPAIPFWQVDAFTSEAWRGNPAGVCILDQPAPEVWMQAVAAEVNVAETAFVHPQPDAEKWALRWFTPCTEVDLCGHATLASAHALWSSGRARGPLAFSTRSGTLAAEQAGDRIHLTFPAVPATEAPLPEVLRRALGATPVWTGHSTTNWLVELPDPVAVAALSPDMGALTDMAALTGIDLQGMIVTAAGGTDSDFVSRYFAPSVGVPEDPVTGSAHCTLAPFWCARTGRDHLVGRQVSARGGRVEVTLAGERVGLGGQAVTVIAGAVRGW